MSPRHPTPGGGGSPQHQFLRRTGILTGFGGHVPSPSSPGNLEITMKTFVCMVLCTAVWLSSSTAMAQVCPNGVQQRKEFRQLIPQEWQAFVNAVKALHAGPAPTRYDQLVKIYHDVFEELFSTSTSGARCTPHLSNLQAGSALSLPFLRKYLSEFERALQAIDPDVVLPYWDWSSDSQASAASLPFLPMIFWGATVVLTHRVVNGQFANWSVRYPQRHVLQRDVASGVRTYFLDSVD